MIKMKQGLSRRDVIKGLGAVGLFSSLRVEQLLAQTSAAPVRVLLVALQHGWGIGESSNRKMAGTAGTDFSFPNGLEPFNSIKDKCVVVNGVRSLGEWGNNHDLSYADIFTAGVLHGTESSSFDGHMPMSVKPSLDYLLQQKSGKDTFRFSAGYQSWGVKYHPVSIDANATVLPFYTKAQDAYNSLFKNLPTTTGGGNTNTSAEVAMLQKVFEYIKNPAPGYLESLPSDEKAKLERYLLAVDHVKTKKATEVSYSGTEKLKIIPATGQTPLVDLPQYLDMIKVGFANQMTTSAVLGIGDINDIPDFHHEHAHATSDIWWNTRRAFAQNIVNFVNEMSQIVDSDGRMVIDNTLIVLSGEVGDGAHAIHNKGHIIIGGGAHLLNSGRMITPKLFTTRDEINKLMRESASGALVKQEQWSPPLVSSRTNADVLREVGNIAGLNLKEFGLASQNTGDVL